MQNKNRIIFNGNEQMKQKTPAKLKGAFRSIIERIKLANENHKINKAYRKSQPKIRYFFANKILKPALLLYLVTLAAPTILKGQTPPKNIQESGSPPTYTVDQMTAYDSTAYYPKIIIGEANHNHLYLRLPQKTGWTDFYSIQTDMTANFYKNWFMTMGYNINGQVENGVPFKTNMGWKYNTKIGYIIKSPVKNDPGLVANPFNHVWSLNYSYTHNPADSVFVNEISLSGQAPIDETWTISGKFGLEYSNKTSGVKFTNQVGADYDFSVSYNWPKIGNTPLSIIPYAKTFLYSGASEQFYGRTEANAATVAAIGFSADYWFTTTSAIGGSIEYGLPFGKHFEFHPGNDYGGGNIWIKDGNIMTFTFGLRQLRVYPNPAVNFISKTGDASNYQAVWQGVVGINFNFDHNNPTAPLDTTSTPLIPFK